MDRIRNLNRYQKTILILMTAVALVFAAVYFVTVQRAGYEYRDTIFVPGQENGSTVYSGKIRGQQARFTVSADKTVVFQCGDRIYGPYTAKEDPTAIPQDAETAGALTGVELRQGEEVLFRGGVRRNRDYYLLFNEDGTLDNISLSYVSGDGLYVPGFHGELPVHPPSRGSREGAVRGSAGKADLRPVFHRAACERSSASDGRDGRGNGRVIPLSGRISRHSRIQELKRSGCHVRKGGWKK